MSSEEIDVPEDEVEETVEDSDDAEAEIQDSVQSNAGSKDPTLATEEEDEISDICVVLDFGSGQVKAGLSTDETPTLIFPSKVGRPREAFKEELTEEHYVGECLLEYELCEKLCLYTPINNGVITEYDDAELIFRYVFERLNIEPHRHPIVLTEPPLMGHADREKIVTMMFEIFKVPHLTIQLGGLLALTGQGKTTGIVLDSGFDVTHTIPVYEGSCFPMAIGKLKLAGHDLNVLFAKLLSQNGHAMTTSADRQEVAKMKEQCCYVSENPFQEESNIIDYKLPDGRIIHVGDERWKTPEALFDPTKIGREAPGVHTLIWDTCMKCSVDVRKKLLQNIIISGGTTCFPGFRERLIEELKGVVPPATASAIKVSSSQDEDNFKAIWIGGQVVASLRSVTVDQWMSAEEFEEYGAEYIHEVIPIKYG